ncbi:hypothetical protein BDY19DRAFT_954992 [Irpex rosettiformis]|uniref:Uncharacterized protein n=1 Tax=Irpex rosettiformis TaxID=378272 RepID=A0ACB8TZ58_9APHY|nr:hypothetical protein BDY19DRAFT_954992 [Irpex rosettiformis]
MSKCGRYWRLGLASLICGRVGVSLAVGPFVSLFRSCTMQRREERDGGKGKGSVSHTGEATQHLRVNIHVMIHVERVPELAMSKSRSGCSTLDTEQM